jgi:type III secretory pathway component EscR
MSRIPMVQEASLVAATPIKLILFLVIDGISTQLSQSTGFEKVARVEPL